MILILGSGRSGTTFLAKLFDSHPNVLYRHEPDSILVDSTIPFQPKGDELGRFLPAASRYLQRLATVRSPKVAVHVPLFPKRFRSTGGQKLHDVLSLCAKALARAPGMERRLRVPDLVRETQEAPRYVIKSVNSLNRARLFSDARETLRIVHIVRHPCGVVASQIRGARLRLMNPTVFFDSLFRMENTARYGLTRDDMERRSFEEQTAFQWMITNDHVFGEMADHPRYRMVRYEDLCLDTARVTAELFEFCGLEKNAQTDAFVSQLEEQAQGDASYFSVMRSPKKAVYKWKEELEPDQIERVIAITSRSRLGTHYTTSS